MGKQLDVRKYFEEGCKCVLDGEVKIAPQGLSNDELWDWYNNPCKCGRGYKLEGLDE